MTAPSLAAFARRGSWGVADQALQSIANFLAVIVFARAAGPSAFGAFSLVVTGITLEITLASAAVTQPFAVLAPGKSDGAYRRYVTSTLLAHGAFGALIAAALLGGSAVAVVLGVPHAGLLVAAVPAMLAMQIQDFLRQVFYVEGRIKVAFINDLLNYGGLCAGMAILAVVGRLTPEAGLAVMAGASGIAVAVGLVQLRRSVDWSWPAGGIARDNRANWAIGRWTLGMAGLSVSSSYLTPFVLGAVSGAAAAGSLRAMLTIMGPVNIAYRTIGIALTPVAARAFDADGVSGAMAVTKKAGLLVGVPVALYGLGVAVAATPLLRFLYGDAYSSVAWLMPLIALSFVLGPMSALADAALRAQRITDTPFRAAVLNFLLFWAAGVPLIYMLGLSGAAITLVSVPVVALVLLIGRLSHEIRRDSAEPLTQEA